MRGQIVQDDELEEFRLWRQHKLKMSSLEQAFESLERIMENPFRRGHDSAIRVIGKCLIELKRRIDDD